MIFNPSRLACSQSEVCISQGRLRQAALTLVELLVVIAIIAILSGLLFPMINAVKESSRKAQAAGEVNRITVAVQAFYTEYGKYPSVRTGNIDVDTAVGDAAAGLKIPNRELFFSLCAVEKGVNTGAVMNPRRVVFFEGKEVADPDHPRNGFLSQSSERRSAEQDCYFDPWERQYCVAIDYSYDQKVKVRYASCGYEPMVGVAAFSLGPDHSLGTRGSPSYSKGETKSDDLTSWR